MFWYSLLSASLKVQEECYASLDICTVARTNPDAIGDVVQVPTHFPNRSGTHTASGTQPEKYSKLMNFTPECIKSHSVLWK